MAGTGFGGLYRLIVGRADLARTNTGTWLSKPAGMNYAGFLEQVSRLVNPSSMGLWQRQMSLGPGPEFCVLGADRIDAPEAFSPVLIELRQGRLGLTGWGVRILFWLWQRVWHARRLP
jgi:hypothetical protein